MAQPGSGRSTPFDNCPEQEWGNPPLNEKKKELRTAWFPQNFSLIYTRNDGFAILVRWHIERRSLPEGEVHSEIQSQCNDCSKDCQRHYEDDKIFMASNC
jgi:hypothetical protein